ncbi:hypothetical protein LTR84_001846 [Exophiala bonariae]|uniref:DJ-1/PfpI domain-containing protein n=1 Tax=Exophiala bonariae TaxID=1690606 RepID=A0AAV9NFI2_9EURO|nr:hypothetical protein LTR84_001846 [Exophiala bonariae]
MPSTNVHTSVPTDLAAIMDTSIPNLDPAVAAAFPKSFGLLLYPQFEVLDAAGPIEALNLLSHLDGFTDMKLSIISKTLDPISIGPAGAPHSTVFTGAQRYLPTHTFETAPPLDVLLIPGGAGSFDMPGAEKRDIEGHVQFVRDAFFGLNGRQKLRYAISVCNGTILLARAGVLDGQKATTNKDGWTFLTAMGPKTEWIAKARWVDSGRVWTTSGVSAGADGVLAWIEGLTSKETVTKVTNSMEWIRAKSPDEDPFAKIFGCEDVLPVEA